MPQLNYNIFGERHISLNQFLCRSSNLVELDFGHVVMGKYKTWTPGPWTPSVDRVHGPGPSKYGPGPWTRSTEGVHGPGVHVLYFPCYLMTFDDTLHDGSSSVNHAYV